MKLHIEVDANGNTVNHPAFEDNLIQAFNTIPTHWEPFVRVPRPDVGIYQVLDSDQPTYQKVNGVWTDVWALRDMTNAEKTSKQQAVKDAWAANPDASNFTAWTFNETTCTYQPPVPVPTGTEGQIYQWQGSTNSWQLMPAYPTDGNTYTFNYTTWTWTKK